MDFISASKIDPLSVFTMDVILEATGKAIMRKKNPITTLLCLQNARDLNGKNCEMHCE